MSNHITQETLLSLDKAEFLDKSTRTQMPIVSPRLVDRYGLIPQPTEGEGRRLPDWNDVQFANVDLMKESKVEVKRTAQGYRVSRAKASQLRRKRGSQRADLRKHYRTLRRSFQGTYELEDLDLVGMSTPLPASYLGVRERILDTVDRLRTPELAEKLGSPRPGHAPIDLTFVAAGLEKAVQAFEETFDQLTEAEKLVDEARFAKEEALKLHRRIYVNVARIQEGYYRLAGLDDLADRLRVTIRQRKPVAVEEPDPVTTDPVTTDSDPTSPSGEGGSATP